MEAKQCTESTLEQNAQIFSFSHKIKVSLTEILWSRMGLRVCLPVHGGL